MFPKVANLNVSLIERGNMVSVKGVPGVAMLVIIKDIR